MSNGLAGELPLLILDLPLSNECFPVQQGTLEPAPVPERLLIRCVERDDKEHLAEREPLFLLLAHSVCRVHPEYVLDPRDEKLPTGLLRQQVLHGLSRPRRIWEKGVSCFLAKQSPLPLFLGCSWHVIISWSCLVPAIHLEISVSPNLCQSQGLLQCCFNAARVLGKAQWHIRGDPERIPLSE